MRNEELDTINTEPDKENINPITGTYSPRGRKKLNRINVLREITSRTTTKTIVSEQEENVVSEIDELFDKLEDGLGINKNIREI
jgi:hypothetical protein